MANTNFWLSATGPLGIGDGSSALNAADASTQAKLDAIYTAQMGGHSAASTITFQYLSGFYQTKGWNFSGLTTIQSGNIHQGAGINLTTIQLIGASSSTGDGVIFGNNGGSNIWVNTWACYDMTLDCNAVNQPKWTGSQGFVGGIICYGGQNLTVQRVKIINFGTPVLGTECFVCCFEATNFTVAQSVDNNLIDSCIFTQPAIGNKDGCSITLISDNPSGNVTITNNNTISNCEFINCWQPAGNSGDFLYQHCLSAPRALGNIAINSGVFWYIEPSQLAWNNITAVVQNNVQIFTVGALTDQFFRILPHPPSGLLEAIIAIYPSNVIIQNMSIDDLNAFLQGYPLSYTVKFKGDGLFDPNRTGDYILSPTHR